MAVLSARVRVASASLLVGTTMMLACTVFNGKSLPDDVADADAAAADGGAESAGPPATCGCDAAGLVLCDSFEQGIVSTWAASEKGPAGPPVIDSTHTHCGSSALYMHLPAVDAATNVGSILSQAQALTDPSVAAGFYARVWVYMTSASRIGPGNTMTFLQVQQDTNQFYGIATQIGDVNTGLVDFTGGVANSGMSNAPLPRDTWACVTWHVAFDTKNGASQLAVDEGKNGTATLTAVDTKPAPPYAFFILQAYFQSEPAAQGAIDIWFDDLAIDDAPLACTP